MLSFDQDIISSILAALDLREVCIELLMFREENVVQVFVVRPGDASCCPHFVCVL